MTVEAEIAKDVSYKFECKKDGLRQNQDGGVKLTININPDDVDTQLFKDAMGQRYIAVLVPIGDNEEPLIRRKDVQESPRRIPGESQEKKEPLKNYAQQAVMLLQDLDFWSYMSFHIYPDTTFTDQESAEAGLKEYLEIKSKTELTPESSAGALFKTMQRDFLQWKDLNQRSQEY